MARFTTTLGIQTPDENLQKIKTGEYVEMFKINQELSAGLSHNTFIDLLKPSTTAVQGGIKDAKTLLIRNAGVVGAEVQIQTNEWSDGSSAPDAVTGDSHQNYLLGAGDFILLPNLRQINFRTDVNSGGAGYVLNNVAPNANMYVAVDNPAAGDAQLLDGAINDTTKTITVDDGSFFYVGDLIRINNEIMEVTDVSGNDLNVIRGSHGSAPASHSDNAALRFPFFNAHADFDKFSVSQTDGSGRFLAHNFFGYARTEGVADGLVPGSFSGKFYNQGYQEIGLSGITPATDSGLDASTTYAFDIAVDGSASDHTLSFTTSTNTRFGSNDGVIRKIQDALNAAFYVPNASTNQLFEKQIIVSIVNGDLRFTSGSHLSTSAISISAPSSGTTPFGVGRFPAVGDIEDPVASRLPQDTIIDRSSGVTSANLGEMFYDDGHGNIHGACNGTIDYRTGAIDLFNAPKNAQFTVSAAYGSAHSGENAYADASANSIKQISARSANSKIYTTIEVIGLR